MSQLLGQPAYSSWSHRGIREEGLLGGASPSALALFSISAAVFPQTAISPEQFCKSTKFSTLVPVLRLQPPTLPTNPTQGRNTVPQPVRRPHSTTSFPRQPEESIDLTRRCRYSQDGCPQVRRGASEEEAVGCYAVSAPCPLLGSTLNRTNTYESNCKRVDGAGISLWVTPWALSSIRGASTILRRQASSMLGIDPRSDKEKMSHHAFVLAIHSLNIC